MGGVTCNLDATKKKNGCGGAISVTERSCAVPTLKVGRHISDKFCAILWWSVNTYSARELELRRKTILRSEN